MSDCGENRPYFAIWDLHVHCNVELAIRGYNLPRHRIVCSLRSEKYGVETHYQSLLCAVSVAGSLEFASGLINSATDIFFVIR